MRISMEKAQKGLTRSNALVSQCDGFGYDWSDQAEEGPTNFALMAYSSISSSSSTNSELKRKLELATKGKDEVQLTVQNFENSSKNLSKLLDRQIMNKCKTGLGYNAIPLPYTGNFMPLKFDLDYPSLDDFVDVNESVSESVVEKPTVETNEPKTSRKENRAPIIKDWVSNSVEKNVPKGKKVNTARPKAVLSAVNGNKGNVVKASACWVWRPKHKVLDHGNPQQDLKDKGVINSGCSRHMTGNRSYLTDYEEINGGFVALELTDETHVLRKVPRKDNMYSVDLKNVIPQGGGLNLSLGKAH
ncbi:hypothetical protein Tco_1284202 [Tanacetum coccineum]